MKKKFENLKVPFLCFASGAVFIRYCDFVQIGSDISNLFSMVTS